MPTEEEAGASRLILPKPLEPIRRQRRVSRRILNIAVPLRLCRRRDGPCGGSGPETTLARYRSVLDRSRRGRGGEGGRTGVVAGAGVAGAAGDTVGRRGRTPAPTSRFRRSARRSWRNMRARSSRHKSSETRHGGHWRGHSRSGSRY